MVSNSFQRSVQGFNGAVLLTDIQLGCFTRMPIEEMRQALNSFGELVDNSRNANVLPVWLTMGEQDQQHNAPFSAEHDPAQFFPVGAQDRLLPDYNDRMRLFENFLENYGPREGEAVFEKAQFGAFETSSILHQYLQNNGIRNVHVVGATAQNCVLASAIGAQRNGFTTSIDADAVVSWTDTTNFTTSTWGRPQEWNRNEVEGIKLRSTESFLNENRILPATGIEIANTTIGNNRQGYDMR